MTHAIKLARRDIIRGLGDACIAATELRRHVYWDECTADAVPLAQAHSEAEQAIRWESAQAVQAAARLRPALRRWRLAQAVEAWTSTVDQLLDAVSGWQGIDRRPMLAARAKVLSAAVLLGADIGRISR